MAARQRSAGDATYFLLMDFGTTSLKTAVVDLDTGLFSHVRSHSALPSCGAGPGCYEVSPEALADRFLSVCDFYAAELAVPFEGIALCSEQNGVLVLDEHDRPVTNYISWKDERSLEPIDGLSTFVLVMDRLGRTFKRITGWRPGPNLPIMGVAHLGRLGALPGRVKLVTLPEWLDLRCGDSSHVAHDTLLHGLGFYSVRDGKTSDDLPQFVADLTGVRATFNPVAPTGTVSALWRYRDRTVPVYVGVGDHQCSVLGACNEPHGTISLNIGTGSQVAVIDGCPDEEQSELRPYFDGRLLPMITRIPAGRALANFVGLLEEAARAGGGEADFWGILSALAPAEVDAATLGFDLAVFSSAWNYRGGGRIERIADGALTVKNYLASLMKAWVAQYPEAISLFDPEHGAARCILSGGLPRRLPHLAGIISQMTGYETWPACQIDESLLGLRTIALVSAGRASSCLEAQALYGRTCAAS